MPKPRPIVRWTNKESSIESKVAKAALDRWGLHSIKLALRGTSGWPDRCFLYEGGPVWVEFKRAGETKARMLQQQRHEYLRLLGYDVHLWNDYEVAMAGLLGYMEKRAK